MLSVLAIALAIVVRIAPAHAEERIPVLVKMMASPSDKTRLSAVLALAKLGDPAAQKPLVTALGDRSARVRAVAATALGRLGCEPALVTLRTLAKSDPDDDVRKAASNAVLKVAQSAPPADDRADSRADGQPGGRADGQPGGRADSRADDRAAKLEADAQARRVSSASHGAGHPPHAAPHDAAAPHADLYLLVNSSADDSPGSADKSTRKAHADTIKRVLIEACSTEPSITSVAGDARRWGIEARHIDLSVTKLEVAKVAGTVEINAQLRLAISDDKGKMLSFLSGGAKVQVSNQKFDPRHLPALRKEALENAMRGMFDNLLAHLRGRTRS